ncbi:MAG: bifunctional 3,4-dihydroxy-2-butanone-4-phosphate synthase/GTP cyclohydrolase II [Chloroflexota bacterium]|nr:bifunctional 3,4-dihydroxy-2-butanone-4-phosphate synthase/GTP cyclohydrolase II [Chloroflexota bacterium]MDE2941107.1 bifunctional 3,4-dihydroxy-2-butanone-4-phosphate synthase/GTP cyclohydrolase II [Chloroflexota bacterium]MDE3267367.1 bifunctional 3,4-dihydroxy-2-butanone-4-phosphate synthase/GTP cyclohydrolase II [Chloroflexota bacterium]
MALATIEQAIQEFRDGRPVILVDDEDRENEGDLIIAAEKATPEVVNFMVTHGRGLVCIPLTAQRLEELGLPMMVGNNTSRFSTAFTVSVDATRGTTTGVSAFDRAATIRAMVDPSTKPEDLARPGHLFPLRYQEGGVLVRAGQTEGSIDLARLAGLYPAAVLCEIMKDDGTMARMPDLEEFAEVHGLLIISVAQIIAYRRLHENMVQRVAEARLPTGFGDFTAVAFKSDVDTSEHLALVLGDVGPDDPVLVRVHSECLTGDVFGSRRCDCGAQIDLALRLIAQEGKGVFLYMRQEGRGIGLHNKIKAYALQDTGLDTVEANASLGFGPDLRHYGIGAQILVDLGVRSMRLLTNNPKKVIGLEAYGIKLEERVPIIVPSTPENERYMETKHQKLGHLLEIGEARS